MKKCEEKLITAWYTFTLILMNMSFASQQVKEVEKELTESGGVYATLREIIGILSLLGVGISIIKMMQIGLKFLTQPAGGRSSAKESIIPWFVGAVVLALFWSISTWILEGIEPTTGGSIFDI